MNWIRKILIIIVILLSSFILWKLLAKRVVLQKKLETESFTLFGSASTREINNLKITGGVNIKNCTHIGLPLKEYCIKAAYNSAVTGYYVNLDMIKYVLSRGCRFLDFEIFYVGTKTYDINGSPKITYKPRVAYSTDKTFTTIDTENSLLLDDVLTTVVTNAFSSPCPNLRDPLFINLRIKSNNKDVYKAVATSIHNILTPKLYVDTTSVQTPQPIIKVTKSTLLSQIMGKAIICMDSTIDSKYSDDTNKCSGAEPIDTCYNLTDFINIDTSSEDLTLQTYHDVINHERVPIKVDHILMTTNIETMKYVVPDTKYDNSLNPNISDFILKYGIQIPAFRFYKNDKKLMNYETFFNDNSSAFVPLAIASTYFEKQL
jgi:hypothetical protein